MAEVKSTSELVLARDGKIGRISIVGDIGWDYFGVSYKSFKQQLADLKGSNIIEVDITSPGGIVTDGIAIMNALVEADATIHVYVNAMAASIASVVTMGADRIFIPTNSRLMVHKPLAALWGNTDDLDKAKAMLDSAETAMVAAYQRHFKGSDDDIRALMKAETFLSAQEVEDKFNNVTVMEQEVAVAAWDKPHAELGKLEDLPHSNQESFADRAVNGLRDRVLGDRNKEVDMTPEEKTALKDEIVQETTSAVVAVLEQRETDAQAKKEADAKAKADTEAKAKADAEAKAKENAVVVEFEGDMEKPEDVQAHLKKVQLATLKASADLSSPEGIVAYQEALAVIQGTAGTKAPAGPGSNAGTDITVLGKTSDEYSQEEIDATVDRMTS